MTQTRDHPRQLQWQKMLPTQQVTLISGTDCSHICSVAELEDAVRKARMEEIRIPFGVGIAGFVAQSKEIINIKDAYKVTVNLQVCICADGTIQYGTDLRIDNILLCSYVFVLALLTHRQLQTVSHSTYCMYFVCIYTVCSNTECRRNCCCLTGSK